MILFSLVRNVLWVVAVVVVAAAATLYAMSKVKT